MKNLVKTLLFPVATAALAFGFSACQNPMPEEKPQDPNPTEPTAYVTLVPEEKPKQDEQPTERQHKHRHGKGCPHCDPNLKNKERKEKPMPLPETPTEQNNG